MIYTNTSNNSPRYIFYRIRAVIPHFLKSFTTTCGIYTKYSQVFSSLLVDGKILISKSYSTVVEPTMSGYLSYTTKHYTFLWYEVQITNFSTVKALIRGHKKATAKSYWSLKSIWIWKRNTQQRMKYCHMQLGFNVTKCLICNTIVPIEKPRNGNQVLKHGLSHELWIIDAVIRWINFFKHWPRSYRASTFQKIFAKGFFFLLQKGHKKRKENTLEKTSGKMRNNTRRCIKKHICRQMILTIALRYFEQQ